MSASSHFHTWEAADWLVANRQGLDAEQRRMFIRWLKASPEHVREYLAITQITQDLRNALSHAEFSFDELLKRARTEKDLQFPEKPIRRDQEKPVLGDHEASRPSRKRGS